MQRIQKRRREQRGTPCFISLLPFWAKRVSEPAAHVLLQFLHSSFSLELNFFPPQLLWKADEFINYTFADFVYSHHDKVFCFFLSP